MGVHWDFSEGDCFECARSAAKWRLPVVRATQLRASRSACLLHLSFTSEDSESGQWKGPMKESREMPLDPLWFKDR